MAVPDLAEAAKGADILIFVVPHQFIVRVCDTIKDHIKKEAVGMSLIKVGAAITKKNVSPSYGGAFFFCTPAFVTKSVGEVHFLSSGFFRRNQNNSLVISLQTINYHLPKSGMQSLIRFVLSW